MALDLNQRAILLGIAQAIAAYRKDNSIGLSHLAPNFEEDKEEIFNFLSLKVSDYSEGQIVLLRADRKIFEPDLDGPWLCLAACGKDNVHRTGFVRMRFKGETLIGLSPIAGYRYDIADATEDVINARRSKQRYAILRVNPEFAAAAEQDETDVQEHADWLLGKLHEYAMQNGNELLIRGLASLVQEGGVTMQNLARATRLLGTSLEEVSRLPDPPVAQVIADPAAEPTHFSYLEGEVTVGRSAE